MNLIPHRRLRYHTWRDIGGFLGLALDAVFCAFVVMAAFAMLAFCTVLVVADYLAAPVISFMSRTKAHSAA